MTPHRPWSGNLPFEAQITTRSWSRRERRFEKYWNKVSSR